MQPELISKRKYFSLFDIKPGVILEFNNEQEITRYIIAGMSLTNCALISVHDNADICSFFVRNTNITSIPLTITINNERIDAYADCSNIFTCPFATINRILKGRQFCYAGQLDNNQLETLTQEMKTSHTIAKNIKSEFFI